MEAEEEEEDDLEDEERDLPVATDTPEGREGCREVVVKGV